MPDTDIERTIYRLELDGSSYIAGVDKLSASTSKLTVEQEKANKALAESEAILKNQSVFLQQTKKDLETYTGTNEKYRQQLTKSFQSAQTDNQKLTDIVVNNRKQYELATKAATDFADVAARAANLQPVQGQGKIPTGPPPGISTQITSQIASVLNVADFTQQAQVINKTKVEFDDLRVSIGLAEQRMKQLNETDEEFKLLAPIVAQGRDALEKYDNAAKLAGNSTERLRTQILQGRDALAGLEIAGKQNTVEFTDLQTHVASLTREYRIAEEEIRVLSSQTRALDFGKAAVQSAVSGFQVFTAVQILAGDSSEKMQKKTLQLFAAMQLLTSLEQLATAVKKGSIIATNLQAAGQVIYTAVTEASTSAVKAFSLALTTIGIGALIVGLGIIADKMGLFGGKTDDAKAALERLDKEIERSNELLNSLAESEDLAGDLLLSKMRERGATKKQLDDQEIENMRGKEVEIYKSYSRQKDALDKFDKDTEVIIKKFQSTKGLGFGIEDEAELRKQRDTASKSLRDDTEKKFNDSVDINRNIQRKQAENAANAAEEARKRGKKEIQDDFESRKAALLEEISRLAETEFQSKKTIEQVYAEKLKKAIISINKDKGLNPEERKELITLSTTLNTNELTKALDDFAKKQKDAREKLNKELNDLQDKNTENSLKFIKDEFEQRAKLIQFNEDKEIVDQIAANQKRLDAFEIASRLLYGKDYQNNKNYLDRKALLVAAGEQAITNIVLKSEQDRSILSQDLFQNLLKYFDDAIAASDLVFTQDEAKAIQALGEKYAAGKISFEKFQKEITKIQKSASAERLKNELDIEERELIALDAQLALIEDTYSEHYKKIKKQRDDLALKIAQDKITQVTDVPDPKKDTELDRVAKYAEAIGAVADSVIQFWQAANDAESKALDRSIQLQETRVAAAQRIADRGNAQYLKQEEDRLTELNVKRENAARKQLGIDAALQASQILVGITGAIAKIGTGIGVAETIAEIAIIIGALATGYGLVKSLQGNQPKLKGGTKDVKRDGHPSGTDTIPAWLNEHEAVLTAEQNKKYHPTVSAIYDGTVPAEHLNNFVKTYHLVKSVPQPDYSRIKEAAEMHIGQDGRMSVLLAEHSSLLKENNELQKAILKKKGVHAELNVDKNGVAMMVTEYMTQMEIDKRT